MDEHECKSMVFLAGGIGSAPVMGMLRTLANRECKKPLTFFYGNPTWDSVIFREELGELEQKLNLRIVHVLERPPENWGGEKGFIDTNVLRQHLPENYLESVYFICGPLPMIEAVEPCLHELDIPRGHIYSEQYEMA